MRASWERYIDMDCTREKPVDAPRSGWKLSDGFDNNRLLKNREPQCDGSIIAANAPILATRRSSPTATSIPAQADATLRQASSRSR